MLFKDLKEILKAVETPNQLFTIQHSFDFLNGLQLDGKYSLESSVFFFP